MKNRKGNIGIGLFLVFVMVLAGGILVVPAVQGEASPGGASPAIQLIIGAVILLIFGMCAWAMLKSDPD